MAPLKTEEILREKNTADPNSITSLTLTHKALTDVSCLAAFKNLERLDLTFNNLSSLQGLEACVNLKWLCVQQNSLRTLKGIESLVNLTVFNAGKNKLKSMGEVKCLLKLRALILNDNEITSISGLDQLTELNTLVLSRNPITKMGDGLAKLKSIEKVSLSNCHLEVIDASIKACTALEQLRLAHNEIKILPAELGYNEKLQILDVGNNMLSRWTDLEALSSLGNLKNLNLLGNPIAEKAKLIKKVSKLAPNLQIFNSKRVDQLNRVKEGKKVERITVVMDNDTEATTKKKKGRGGRLQDDATDTSKEKSGEKMKVEMQIADEEEIARKPKKKKQKHVEKELTAKETVEMQTEKRSKRKAEGASVDFFDDKENPFMEYLAYSASEIMESDEKKVRDKIVGNADANCAVVTYPAKRKKTKDQETQPSKFEFVASVPEIGLGGPSAWDV